MYNSGINGQINSGTPYDIVDAIPYADSYSQILKPIPSSVYQVGQYSNNAAQNNGGSFVYQITAGPTSFLRSGSVALRGLLTLNGLGGTSGNCFFNNISRTSSAITDRVTVSVGSQVLETVENYADVDDLINIHCSNSILDAERAILQGAKQNMVPAAGDITATSYPIRFCIPLSKVGMLNGVKNVPLALLNGQPLIIKIDLQPNVYSMVNSATVTFTSATVSEMLMTYECIDLPAVYISKLQEEMKSGAKYNFPVSSINTYSQSATASMNPNFGAMYSSLNSVLWTFKTNTVAANSSPVWTSNTPTLIQYTINGKLRNQYDTSASNYYALFGEFRKAVQGGSLESDDTNSLATTTLVMGTAGAVSGTYVSSVFCAGINLTRSSSPEYLFRGDVCNNLQLKINSSGDVSNKNLLVFCPYSYLVQIDQFGICERSN